MNTIFITGSSSGIGYETAKLFAKNGWEVIATMRNTGKGEELGKLPNVEIVKLDVSNHAEIISVVADVLAKHDVDVVLNNAGYGLMAPLEVPTEEQIRKVFDTDVFGTLYVNQEFIPYFKKRRKGMIMATTSLAAIIGLPRDGVYGAAKRAQQSMMESLYYELRPFGVAVKTMIPGGSRLRSTILLVTRRLMHASRNICVTATSNLPLRKKLPRPSIVQLLTTRISCATVPTLYARSFTISIMRWATKSSSSGSMRNCLNNLHDKVYFIK